MRLAIILFLLLTATPLIPAQAQSPIPPQANGTSDKSGANTAPSGARPTQSGSGALPGPSSAQQRRSEENAAIHDGFSTGTAGPADVTLRDAATLKVPDGMVFIPAAQAARIMRALGNSAGDNLVGLVMSKTAPWLVVIRQTSEGYVKDDDAKDFDADVILKSLQDGTEEGNEDRSARGFAPLEVTGWLQPPQYDAATHRLIWAALVREKGDTDPDQSVNYNTRVLGRDGYFSLNLITDQSRFDQDRPVALGLLGGLNYQPGKTYTDFNASTDHIAEYGLAALLGVVAFKKLGLLALAAAFLLKGGAFFLKGGVFLVKLGKLALVGVGVVVAGIVRLFKRKTPAS